MKTNKQKGIVIAAYPCTGKTFLETKYANVLDLRTTPYYEIGKDIKTYVDDNKNKKIVTDNVNPEWPGNYIKALRKAQEDYDIILTIVHPDKMLKHLDAAGIKYLIVMPRQENIDVIIERAKARGNSPEFYNALRLSDTFFKFIKDKPEICYLERNDYLEDWLIRNGYKLLAKNLAAQEIKK